MCKQPRRISQFLAVAMMMVASVSAYATDDFPGNKPDRRIIKMQEKVDALFEKGDYERAYFIYREELVPLGDKYAQYMVGYMTLVGKGVPSDLIAGSAWYRLAAERGDAAFLQSSNEALSLLNDEQRQLSDQRYAELRRDFSDAMIVANLIEEDLRALTGSMDAWSWAGDQNRYQYVSKEALARDNAEAIARVENLLGFLSDALDTPNLLTEPESERVNDIVRRADDLLQIYRSKN